MAKRLVLVVSLVAVLLLAMSGMAAAGRGGGSFGTDPRAYSVTDPWCGPACFDGASMW